MLQCFALSLVMGRAVIAFAPTLLRLDIGTGTASSDADCAADDIPLLQNAAAVVYQVIDGAHVARRYVFLGCISGGRHRQRVCHIRKP